MKKIFYDPKNNPPNFLESQEIDKLPNWEKN